MTAKIPAERNLAFLLNDLARMLRRNFDRRVQSLGLTQAQWRAIAHLSRDEGMTQVALAESLEVQPITLARLIDRMEGAGWIERRNHPLDRRAIQLYLTAKSQPLLAEMHARGHDTLQEALAGLSAAARRDVIDALQLMKQNLLAAETAMAGDESKPRTNKDVGRRPLKLQRAR